jgi:hypothetical protein
MTNMGNESITAIKHIKRKLDLNEMSVLVGAGFSKNIDLEAFLSWKELLKPMVLFLFGDEIEIAYNSIPSSRTKKKFADFTDNRVQHYINKIGYTRIATLYAERKGNLESITAFIEANTPWIKDVGNKKYLFVGSEGIQIKKLEDDVLSQHRLLVGLNWNNIYTTNYDNALESVLDREGRVELTLKSQQIAAKIREIESAIINIEKESINLTTHAQDKEKRKSPQDEKTKETIDKTSVLNSLKVELDKNRQNFLLLENALHEVIDIVSNSSELRIKRNKNIIKLHGSLRHLEEGKQYGFDGDNRNQYIFSEESYKQYPLKHEAFTSLMRISLLQESFLLIGFSGMDPNFTEWIKWVRDIIEIKHGQDIKKEDKTNNYKIYLIDLESSPLDNDLKLYYENHNIFRIKLMDEDVITYLEHNSLDEVKKEKSYRYVINLLLKYFSTEIQSLSIKLALTQFESNTISTLVKNIAYSRNLNFENKINLFVDIAKNSSKEDIAKYIKLDISETTAFIKVLQELHNNYIATSSKTLNKEDKGYLLKSICIIIDILNLPIYEIFDKAQQQRFKKAVKKTKNQPLIDYYFVLNEKFSIFQSVPQKTHKSAIYKAYDLMYKLKIYDLLRYISKWNPKNEEERFTKLSIQYLFNQINSSDYLSFENIFKQGSLNIYLKYIKLAKIIINIELIYSMDIDTISQEKLNQRKSQIDIKIKYLEQNGITSGEDIVEEYINQLETKKKIEKYGNDRFSTSKTVYIGMRTPEEEMTLAAVQGLYSIHKYKSYP